MSTLPANTEAPKVTSFKPIFAFPVTMIRWSQAVAIMQPPATVWPLRAATIGLGWTYSSRYSEESSTARQDDRTDGRVLFELAEGVAELPHHFRIQGVHLSAR